MTQAIISFDTELSALLHQQGVDPRANFESSVLGKCGDGEFGIGYQMDRLDHFGLHGVFFVDPLPALVYGPGIVEAIVHPIIARGHEVQLHIHTEWLAFASDNPLGDQTGRNIADFSLTAQRLLIGLAKDMLMAAGAPCPIAFRAGNFGANDDTMRALAGHGFLYDSSFNGAFAGQECQISLDPSNMGLRPHLGICEVPVSGMMGSGTNFRPAQLCAMSKEEMCDALGHAASCGAIQFSAFSHSFELLSRDRAAPNFLAVERMDALFRAIATDARVHSGGFGNLSIPPSAPAKVPPMRPNPMRSLRRNFEQGMGYLRHEIPITRKVAGAASDPPRWGKIASGIILAMA